MPPMPPLEHVVEIALEGLLVPILVAVVIGYLSSRFLSSVGRICGELLAVCLAFLAGNYFREAVEFRLDSERPLAVVELGKAAWQTVTGSIAAGQTIPSFRYWLPWSALVAALVGLLIRVPRFPQSMSWVLRIATVVCLSRLLVGPALRTEIVWLWPLLALVLLANWYVLEVLGREPTSWWLPSGIVWMFFAAATVLIHAHTARFTDIATVLAGCWIGVAVVSKIRPASRPGGSALPLTAIALPGLMLIAQQSTYSEVPLASFVLMGLAPTALGPLLLIPSAKKQSWSYMIAAWALVLIPTVMAIVLAMRAETLSFE